jgi:MFS family permease
MMRRGVEHNERLVIGLRWLKETMFSIPVMTMIWQASGLTHTNIYVLQCVIFAGTALLFELPSGILADVYGRRNILRAGAIISGLGFGLYWLIGRGFASMAVGEVVLGIGFACISGADSALVSDSQIACGQRGEGLLRRFESRSMALGSLSNTGAYMASGVIAAWLGQRSTLLADTLLYIPIIWLTFMLTEPPRKDGAVDPRQRPTLRTELTALRAKAAEICTGVKAVLGGDRVLRWLIIYGAVLGTSTYTMVWIWTDYFSAVGIQTAAIGLVWGAQALFQWLVSWSTELVFSPKQSGRALARWRGHRPEPHFLLPALVAVSVASYAGLAWVGWVGLVVGSIGLVFIRAVLGPMIREAVAAKAQPEVKATVMSVSSLSFRVVAFGLGPTIGLFYDHAGIASTMLASAAIYGGLGGFVLWRLRAATADQEHTHLI